ncbi:hypothetical protein SpiBuddy_0914 [Sphaerochaeta globosa str. Buddy]|uniref:Uncharacterized protein n=2 Tax=Sphaerochaeta TaxID=399320 RepID=F0RYH0_SPHGB|nr:hypothetical protein SpiBuddy_0914 [Sphaerochaeta globosa str. Buddy]
MKMHIDVENLMNKRFLVVLFFCLLSLAGLFASSVEVREALPLLSEAEYQALDAGEMVYGRTLDGGKIAQFFVQGTEASKRAELAQQEESGFSIGAVSYIPYGPKLKAMDPSERQLAVFNAIRAISTQEGLTYISWRAGNKEKVLIEKSSYMEDSKNLNKLVTDPVATVFPFTEQSYVYQRDSSFGGNRYLHTYTNTDKEIFVEISNISSLKVLGLFTAVKAGQLSINMGTYQLDEGLLLVALTSVRDRKPEVSVLGLTVDLPSAFRRRIVALQNWFISQLNTLEIE